MIAVTVGEGGCGFFSEREFVFGDHTGFANAQLRFTHLLDDDSDIGECPGQHQPRLGIRLFGFQCASLSRWTVG